MESMGRSLAPSPTAMTCSRRMPSRAGDLAQQFGLAGAVDDGAGDLAGEPALLELQSVGVDVVDAEAPLQVFGEVGEAAGEDRDLVAELFQRADQALGAVGDGQAFGDAGQHRFIQPLQ